MLNKSKTQELYSKIQTQLFYMIPEKWDKIYLYASVNLDGTNIEKSEMFFYYYPKGILKREPINVYEVPSKFNIDEDEYNKIVDKLYNVIKLLYIEFENSGEKLWDDIIISIENNRFEVEYRYEDDIFLSYNSYDRHIIWKYKYLNYPIERMKRKDQEMLKLYLVEESFKNIEVKKHTEGIYKNKVHNIIEYNKEDRIEEQEDFNINSGRKLDKYEIYKLKQKEKKQEKQKENIEFTDIEEKKKSQILNF